MICNISRTGCPTFHSKSRKTKNIKKEINLDQSGRRMNVHHSCVKKQKNHQNAMYEGITYFQLHYFNKNIEIEILYIVLY